MDPTFLRIYICFLFFSIFHTFSIFDVPLWFRKFTFFSWLRFMEGIDVLPWIITNSSRVNNVTFFLEIQLYFAELFGNDWIFFSIFISAAKYFGMLKKSVVVFGFCLIFHGGMKCWWKIPKFRKITHFQSIILTQWCEILIWILVRWKVEALSFPTHKNWWPYDALPLL